MNQSWYLTLLSLIFSINTALAEILTVNVGRLLLFVTTYNSLFIRVFAVKIQMQFSKR